jgi:GNAT superfamily N-acetyltransferase
MKVVKLNVTKEDVGRIHGIITRDFANEHSMGKLSASNHNLEKGLLWGIKNIECGAWVVEDDDGNVLGTLGVHRTAPWYSDEEYLADGWFYVLPEYRKTGVGKMLLDTAVDFAKQQNLPLIIGVFNMDDTAKKVEIMNRMGLKLIGGLFAAGV